MAPRRKQLDILLRVGSGLHRRLQLAGSHNLRMWRLHARKFQTSCPQRKERNVVSDFQMENFDSKIVVLGLGGGLGKK